MREHQRMTQHQSVLRTIYALFNARDIDGALSLMTDDVHWPKASEGGSIVGKAEIRAYWSRQWAEFDPHVEPLTVEENEDGSTLTVRVHQLVKNIEGSILSDSEVVHIFTLREGLIAAMTLGDAQTASAAFGHTA